MGRWGADLLGMWCYRGRGAGGLEAECELQTLEAAVGEEHLRATELGPEVGRAIPDHD